VGLEDAFNADVYGRQSGVDEKVFVADITSRATMSLSKRIPISSLGGT
jgi:hypothetical protein